MLYNNKKYFGLNLNLKLLLLITLSFTLLYSDTSKQLVSSIEKAFESQNYTKACRLVDIFYEENPYEYKANIYYGKCALHAKDIDKAVAAYDRAEILNNKDALVYKEIGDLHARIGNIEIANREYDKADSFGADDVQRAKVCKHNPHKFSLLARLSFGYDSNVKYNAELSELQSWSNLVGLSAPKSDTFVKEYLRMTHVYDYDPYTAFYYKSQAHIYNKNYIQLHAEDWTQGELYSGPGWASKSFDIWLPFSYTYVSTDYEAYAEIFSIKPQVRNRFDNGVLLKLETMYNYYKYKQWNGGDKDSYTGEISLSRWFDKNYVRVAYTHQIVDKKDSSSTRIFIDKNINELELNYTRAFDNSLEFGLSYLYSKTDYNDIARVGFTDKREDTLDKYSTYLSYNISKNSGIIAQYDYYDNSTNYTPLSYTKDVASVGMYLYY